MEKIDSFGLDQISDFITSPSFKISDIKPSDWAEQKRYMGSEVSNFKGKFSYDLTPYLKEIVDMLSPSHPMTECVIMKGSQQGMSTGIIENGIGYLIDQCPGQIILAARDEGLVKIMMESKIDQMIDSCGLRGKLKSNIKKARNQRTGDTSMKKEFDGGRLLAFSIQQPGRMRQVSAQYGFLDDFEAAPADKDAGSADDLFRTRFTSYGDKRKIFWISTPEVKHTSNIEPLYFEGDQRKWNVPCPNCGSYIVLEWKTIGINGKHAGIIFKVDEDGDLIEESVGYRCQNCGEDFHEGHKHEMNLAGKWVPTAKQKDPTFFSYQINSLNAPSGMADWVYYVRQFLKARPHGQKAIINKYKTFVQTVLGQTWEEKGNSPKVTLLSQNTRSYEINSVPQELSIKDGNGHIVMVTVCADLNSDNVDDARLDYEIVAWSESGVSYSVDHGSIGTFIPRENTRKVKVDRERWSYIPYSERNVWDEFIKVLQTPLYSEDGLSEYKIMVFGLDTGNHTQYAYNFVTRCNNEGVFCVGLKGQNANSYRKNDANTRSYAKAKERSDLYMVQVNQIKDELAGKVNLRWVHDDGTKQPYGFMNFPTPSKGKYTMKDYFIQYESEHKVMKEDPQGKEVGYIWQKKNSNVINTFWDCRVYNEAVKEILTDAVCKELKIDPSWKGYCAAIVGN